MCVQFTSCVYGETYKFAEILIPAQLFLRAFLVTRLIYFQYHVFLNLLENIYFKIFFRELKFLFHVSFIPGGIQLFKINKETRRHSGIFILNFEQISHLVLMFLLLTLNKQRPFGIE